MTERGTPVLARYLIADGGITKANLYYNLTNFLATAKGFSDRLAASEPLSDSYQPGQTSTTGPAPVGLQRPSRHMPSERLPLVEQLGRDLPADVVNRSTERSNWSFDNKD